MRLLAFAVAGALAIASCEKKSETGPPRPLPKPRPNATIDKPFLMPVEDVFVISGRGTVVTGRVERGMVKVADVVEIVGFRETVTKVVDGVETFRKLLDQAASSASSSTESLGRFHRGKRQRDLEQAVSYTFRRCTRFRSGRPCCSRRSARDRRR